MKKVLNNLTIAIGIVIICASLFGYGLDKFGYVDIPNDKTLHDYHNRNWDYYWRSL